MQSKIIVGLGNPGTEYENTRHNIGFAVLDAFGEKYKIVGKQEDKLLSWYGKGKIELDGSTYNIILAWPTVYMNNSGEAVLKLVKWFKLDVNDLIVVHDEVALDLGRIRVSYNRGAAGHHGIESVIKTLGGDKEFTRLRIGIGPDPGKDIRTDYVLSKFLKKEDLLLKKVINTSINAIETILSKDVGEAMNRYNGLEVRDETREF